MTSGSAVRHVSVVRHFTDCVSLPSAQFVKIPVYGFTFSVVVDSLLIVTPILGFCNCSMFCCALFYFHSSIAII